MKDNKNLELKQEKMEMDKTLELEQLGTDDSDDGSEDDTDIAGDDGHFVGGNRISLSISNFSINLISSNTSLDKLQSLLDYYLLLSFDEGFKADWIRINKKALITQFEDSLKQTAKLKKDGDGK